MFAGADVIRTKDPNEVVLPPQVEEWLPVDRDTDIGI